MLVSQLVSPLGAAHKWRLWHPLVLMSAYHQLLACPLVLQIDDVSPEPKMIIFGWSLKMPINHPLAPKGVQLSLVRLTRAFFGWIPSNRWIFHHSSSFLMTLSPSSSAFVSFLSYHWLFNVATSFVNGPFHSVSFSADPHPFWLLQQNI